MKTIQVNVPDELADKLTPYQENLAEVLELGLEQWEKERQERLALQERIRKVLADSGMVRVPTPYPGKEPYQRHTPIEIEGETLSEIVIRLRGPL